MLYEDYLFMTPEQLDSFYAFKDFKLSDFVFDNELKEFQFELDGDEQANTDEYHLDTPLNSVAPIDPLTYIPDAQKDDYAIVNYPMISGRDIEQNLDYELYEETVILTEMSSELMTNENPFESIADPMLVNEQPKADQRARYASDGLRFLPDSRKHPMSIQLPNLSTKSCETNEIYGIILTMVTSMNNPERERFLHVNGIKYYTEDAIALDNGSIFIPISKEEIENCEKKFPRLSIICKKFDDYTFELITFNSLTEDKIPEKYTLKNEANLTKAAKGKRFTSDYDLLCYQIIFQLAFKRDNQYFLSHIVCETDLINEQKAPEKELKRKKVSKKRKGNMDTCRPWKKSKA